MKFGSRTTQTNHTARLADKQDRNQRHRPTRHEFKEQKVEEKEERKTDEQTDEQTFAHFKDYYNANLPDFEQIFRSHTSTMIKLPEKVDTTIC